MVCGGRGSIGVQATSGRILHPFDAGHDEAKALRRRHQAHQDGRYQNPMHVPARRRRRRAHVVRGDGHDRHRHRNATAAVAAHSFKDLSGFLDRVDDGGRRRRHNARCARRVRRAADGDAAVGLPERRRVVHIGAGQVDDVSGLPQASVDLDCVRAENAPEAVRPFDRLRRAGRKVIRIGAFGEHVAADEQMGAAPELLFHLATVFWLIP
ncbi:hypothetical protein [Methylocella sp.]|uniref:hypothetical protein n=1 Tax=Methylocella sp. TaxID=1978226 RepID=UPI0037843C49